MINTYLNKTAFIGGKESKLMISFKFKKPHNKVTQKTTSRWLKTSLKLAGIDTDIFKGHSICSSASSAAKTQGPQMTDILSIAGWSNEEKFARYYNKHILTEIMLFKIQSSLKIETNFVFIETLYLRIHQISDLQVILLFINSLSWSACH